MWTIPLTPWSVVPRILPVLHDDYMLLFSILLENQCMPCGQLCKIYPKFYYIQNKVVSFAAEIMIGFSLLNFLLVLQTNDSN